jgi:hypothetical protein
LGIWDWGVRRTVDESGKGRTEWTWFAAWLFVVICGGLFYFPYNMVAWLVSGEFTGFESWMFTLSSVVTMLLVLTGILALWKDSRK